jgi:hypothetical protein
MQSKTATKPEITLRRRHGQFVATVPSNSRKNLCHTIRVMEADLTATCTCLGFVNHGHCYHCDSTIAVARTLKPRKQRRAEPRAVVADPDPFKELLGLDEEIAALTRGDLEAIERFDQEQAWNAYRTEQCARNHAKGGWAA